MKKRPFYILGTSQEIEERTKTDPGNGNGPTEKDSPTRKLYFHGARDIIIDGETYVAVPLSEVASLFHLTLEDFLENEMLDALGRIRKMVGYSIIINL